MVDKGYNLQFKNVKCRILGSSINVIASGTKIKGNIFDLSTTSKSCLIAQVDESWLWHRRLCHVKFDNIIKISSTQLVRNLPKLIKPTNNICKECQLGKKSRFPFRSKQNCSNEVLELVHTDLCGPSRVKSLQGDRYFMLLIDDYSRLMWVTFLREKL